jgi:hypothetical protein
MSHPGLDADLSAALEVLAELGPLQVLDVHPSQPRRRPATPLAPAAAPAAELDELEQQPSLFDPPGPEPATSTSTSTTDPLGHIPPSRRRREVLGLAGAGRPHSPAVNP